MPYTNHKFNRTYINQMTELWNGISDTQNTCTDIQSNKLNTDAHKRMN